MKAIPDRILAHEILTHDEERALFAVLRDASRPEAERRAARDELVAKNLKLVVSRIRALRRAPGRWTFEDAFQWGVVGLIRAIDRFEPERGLRLSTYAPHWIRQAINRGAHDDLECGPVAVPCGFAQAARRYLRARDRGRSEAEAMEEAKLGGYNRRYLGDAVRALAGAASLAGDPGRDVPATDPVDHRDAPEDLDAPDVADLEAALAHAALSPRELDLLARRFGLADRVQGLHAIGEAIGVTRERVRQVERAALRKLRDAARRAKDGTTTRPPQPSGGGAVVRSD